MTDHNAENKMDNAVDSTDKEKSSGKKRISSNHIISAILVVIVISAGLYLNSRIDKVSQTAAGISQDISGHSESINNEVRKLKEETGRLSEQTQRLQSAVTDAVQSQPGSNEDWALQEAEYLLVIATHRLLLENDIDTAIAAMESALLRLGSLDIPDLMPVREQLVSDINRLKEVNTVDIPGLAVYLAGLIENASDLPVKETDISEQQTTSGQVKPDAGRGGFMQSIWQELKSLVVIKKAGEIKQELLLPDQEYFLYQNLRLELESARLSALRHDTENFHASIRMIMNWLNRYYNTSDNSVSNVMETLEKMSTLNLDPELPAINSSLETLRAYMRNREPVGLLPAIDRMAVIA